MRQGQSGGERHALELKVWRKGKKEPLAEGRGQLDSYLQRLGLEESVLVVCRLLPHRGGR